METIAGSKKGVIFFMDIMDLINNTDPGILAFGAVLFLPGFIIAAAAVYFVLRSIVRGIAAPSLQRKEKREKDREQRKWDELYGALDRCTVYDVSPLPANIALIEEMLSYHVMMSRRRLDEREQFICYKRLEQLGKPDYATLGWLYVEHFNSTDKDKDAALKYTGILANQGYANWMMDHARLLEKYRNDEASIQRAMNLYRKLAKTDNHSFIPLLANEEQGPQAACRLSKLLLSRDSTDEELAEAYKLRFLAALHNESNAVQYLKAEYEKFRKAKTGSYAEQMRQFEMKIMKLVVTADDETTFRNMLQGAYFGIPYAFTLASSFCRRFARTADIPDDEWRVFCLDRLGATMGNALCSLNAGTAVYLGRGRIPEDHDLSERWLRQAAKEESRSAYYTLGLVLMGNHKSTEAIEWFEKAANAGLLASAEYLQKIYTDGMGRILSDAGKAEHWKAVAEKLRKKTEEE